MFSKKVKKVTVTCLPLKRVPSTLFVICFLLCVPVLFFACQIEKQETGDINGTWIYVYKEEGVDDYITTISINTQAKTVEYLDTYTGNIVNTPDYTSSFGVLIIQFTKYFDWDYSNWPLATSYENPEKAGKYGALYWRNLTEKTVLLSDAYEGFSHVIFTNLSDALSNFTLSKSNTYVDWGKTGAYTKQ